MRKIMIAAAVAALASVGAIRHADAQAFYPNGSASAPTHGGYSTYPGGHQAYPSQRPAYPSQYPLRNATNAFGTDKRNGSGLGTTAASATAGCSISTLSSSNGLIR